MQLHISYNNLTSGKSKEVREESGGRTRYFLMGSDSLKVLFRAEVNKDFFDCVGENTYVEIPTNLVKQVDPTPPYK